MDWLLVVAVLLLDAYLRGTDDHVCIPETGVCDVNVIFMKFNQTISSMWD